MMAKAKTDKTMMSPGGEEVYGGDTVTVSREEWDRLHERLEDLTDALVVERFRREEAAGKEAFIASEVANRLIDGEPPLKVWRTYRGLTQEALAEASGVSRAMIADIETGRKSGSIDTIGALAKALDVSLTDLVLV